MIEIDVYLLPGNTSPENKTNQFLGASMASDGENLVVRIVCMYNIVGSN